MVEYRFQKLELPEEGSRILQGTVLPYGEIAQGDFGPEKFLPGSLDFSDVVLNVQHDRGRPIARTPETLILTDSEKSLELHAELPETTEATDALVSVRSRLLRGLSVEFSVIEQSFEAGIRVIRKALLTGIGLVDSGAYKSATVEARARFGYIGTGKAFIPKGTKLDCRCKDGCDSAIIMDAEFPETVIGVRGNYGEALGSVKRGTLRVNPRKDGKGWDVEQDLPDTQQARDLMASSKSADIYARPFMDAQKSDVVVEGGTATYKKGVVRAVVFETTDQSRGWEPVKFEAAKKAKKEGRMTCDATRGIPFWL